VLNEVGGGEAGGHYLVLVNITQMMQEWANGPESKVGQGYADDGLMFKLASGSANNTLEFIGDVTGGHENAIYATEWEQGGQGSSPEYTMLPFPLTDRMSMSVNVASGNLLVESNDLHVAGRGLDFNASRVYNSLNDFENEFGNWQDSNQPGLRKESANSETSRNLIWFRDGSGAWFQFFWDASTSEYITPPGIKATLCASYSASPCPVSSTYRLTFNESQTHIDFNSYGAPVDVEDRHGNKLSSNGGDYPPTQWTDTEGRDFTYTKEKGSKGEEFVEGPYTSLTDVSGERTVHYAYEQHENFHNGPQLTAFTDANGQITHYKYESTRLVKITTPRGEVININYVTDSNRVSKITRTTNAEHTEGPTWTFKYYKAGEAPAPCTAAQQATVVQDPDGSGGEAGHTTTYCANAWDQVEKTVDADGNETATSYDAFGNVSAITAPARETGDSRGVTSFVYGTNGQNLLCEVQGTTAPLTECPSGALEQGYGNGYNYKDETFPFQDTESISPRQFSTNICYWGGSHACTGSGSEGKSAEGEVKRETDSLASQNSVNYSYNSNGTVSSSEDADGNTTSYEYDSSGNLKAVIPPSGSGLGKETISDDADSRPHVITQCLTESGGSCISSETATITYDKLDRVTEAVYTGPGATKTFKYTYNADGGLEKVVEPGGTTTYTLDPLGRVIEESLPGGATNAYGYDASSNLTSFTDSGGTTHYLYNGLNQLEAMYEPGGTCSGTPSKCTRFRYDNVGSLRTITYPSGASLGYKLDPTTGRVTLVEAENPKGETLLSNSYSYSEGTNDTPLIFNDLFEEPKAKDTASTEYKYDELDRLIKADTESKPGSYAPSCYLYAYDGDGNRTSEGVTMTESTCTTSGPSYDYNSGNELECRMKKEGACSKSSSSEISGYSYDGAGDETAITGYSDPASTKFAYNNLDQLQALTPPSSSEQALTYLGTGQSKLTGLGSIALQNSTLGLTKQINESGTSYYARTPTGLMVDERLPSGASYNPVYDAQGDVVGLLNSSGELVQTVRYGPYGENANASGSLSYSATNDPFMFQGGYHTSGGNAGTGNVPNGLYHFGERYYDPTTGRFMQADPTSRTAEYEFAGDNPIDEGDPSGENYVNWWTVNQGTNLKLGLEGAVALSGELSALGPIGDALAALGDTYLEAYLLPKINVALEVAAEFNHQNTEKYVRGGSRVKLRRWGVTISVHTFLGGHHHDIPNGVIGVYTRQEGDAPNV
jgi:RHS repeat-associated protein